MTRAIATIRSSWLVVLIACILGGGGGFGMVVRLAQAPAVALVGVREADGLAVVNGALEIQLTIIRTHQCDAHVERWMWQPTNAVYRYGRPIRRWVNLPSTANPPTPLNVEVTYIVSIPLPSNVTIGDWFYWSRAYDNCPLVPALQVEPRESPDVPVRVTQVATGPAGAETLLPLLTHPAGHLKAP